MFTVPPATLRLATRVVLNAPLFWVSDPMFRMPLVIVTVSVAVETALPRLMFVVEFRAPVRVPLLSRLPKVRSAIVAVPLSKANR